MNPQEQKDLISEITKKPWALVIARWLAGNKASLDPDNETALLLSLNEAIEGLLSQAIQTERESLREKVEGLVAMQWNLKDGTGTEPTLLRRQVLNIFSSKEESHEGVDNSLA